MRNLLTLSWRVSPGVRALAIGVLTALVLAPSLTGCSGAQTPLGRVLSVLQSDGPPLSAEATKQLDRFKTVYRAYSETPERTDELNYFTFAFQRTRAVYVREVPDASIIDAAIKGVRETKAKPGTLTSKAVVEAALETMISSLDPHSAYLNAEAFRESFVQTKGEFGGLGIEITLEEDLVKIIAPIEDTPAARAGLKAGDLITHVDGEPIKGKTLIQAVRRMRGRPGTQITLTIRRAGGADFPVTLSRAVIKIRAVRWRIEDDIGYVRVNRFTEKMETGIAVAMADIHARLGRRLAGIVLDLRNNPGGLLDQSLVLADAFLEQGEIVSVRGRNHNHDRSYQADPGDLAKGVPMVVLINSGSASASEIVASALQFHRRAAIMGGQSFGKGSVQTILPMPIEGGLKLTTALYYSPSGEAIQARGVVPDIVITPAKKDETAERRRESDLPGALPPVGDAHDEAPHPAVPETACPAVGEKEDRPLGCAMAYLHAGSAKAFLAMFTGRPQI